MYGVWDCMLILLCFAYAYLFALQFLHTSPENSNCKLEVIEIRV